MRLKWLLLMSLAGLILVIVPQMTQAQSNTDSCPALVKQALAEMGNSCENMDRNNACYGYNRVDSTFAQTMPQNFFTRPADRAQLAEIESITTAPLDLNSKQWGVAVMNVQANIPSSLPGQAAVFLLLGDTQVTDTVPPDQMATPAQPVNLTTIVQTQVYSGPDYNTNVIVAVAPDTVLPAEGVSSDGLWLHVVPTEGEGWARREVFGNVPGIDTLPEYKQNAQTPMQSFQVRTAFNDLLCNDAPSLLAIQSPKGMTVDLTANGVHIQMGSLVLLRTVQPGNAMQVMTVEGNVVLDPGTPNELPLPAGHLTQRCVDDSNMVYDGCGWLPPLPMTATELQWAQTVLQAYALLGHPATGTVQVGGQNVTLINTESCPAGTTVKHTVQQGDNLFQLGLRYGTSSEAIMAENSLPTTEIVVGQELTILCGTQSRQLPSLGAPPAPPVAQPPPPPPSPVDCSKFRATSPLDGIAYGSQTFYWDAAPGATDYRVYVVGESGTFSFMTDGSHLNLTADTSNSSIGFGFNFQWNVEALYNGQVMCRTPLARMQRASQPPGRHVKPTATPNPQCQPICDVNGIACYNPCLG